MFYTPPVTTEVVTWPLVLPLFHPLVPLADNVGLVEWVRAS